jgi:hypothetical protein
MAVLSPSSPAPRRAPAAPAALALLLLLALHALAPAAAGNIFDVFGSTDGVEVIGSPLIKGTVGRYIPGTRRLRNGMRNRGRGLLRRLLADAAAADAPFPAPGSTSTDPSHTV